MTPSDVQAAFATTLVDEWVRAGTTDAVVAPGSRSTPMLVALDANPNVRVHVVLDERSAGFMALGMGVATGRPAPVVTTSGTAAVELHPAVVEAHHAGVPLLVVTADRPPELHHVAAPQTVDQEGLYGRSVRFSAAPGVAMAEAAPSWRSLASRAWASTVGDPLGPGPVHLNLAFREPLLALDQQAAAALVPPGRADGRPWHRVAGGTVGELTGGPGKQDRNHPVARGPLVRELAAAPRRGVIVAGAGCGDPRVVLDLANSLGWPVLADPCSGCRVPDPSVVAGADALLRTATVSGWHPDLVLRLGRPWASKVLAGWLARLPAATRQILVDPRGQWADADGQVGEVAAVDPTALCRAVLAVRAPVPENATPPSRWRRFLRRQDGPTAGPPTEKAQTAAVDSEWRERWQRAERAAAAALAERLRADGLSEPQIARAVVASVPDGTTVVASSSMPVRDIEWFSAPRQGVRVLANRGANGIDGVVSTVLGVALASTPIDSGDGPPVVGVVGDLAFLHDAGALLWARRRRLRCTLVVVDNDGGGIFSFLPQAEQEGEGARERFERLWGTPHGLNLEALAAAYAIPTHVVTDAGELTDILGSVEPGLRVVLARTPRDENVKVHDRLNAAVADAVAAAIS